MKAMSSSVIGLIVANLCLLIAALVFEWSIYEQIVGFWLENLVVGFYTIFKLAKTEKMVPMKLNGVDLPEDRIKPVIIPFFIFHYFLFCIVHVVFINHLFGDTGGLFNIPTGFRFIPDIDFTVLISSLLVLGISHGISFVKNFLGNKIYQRDNIGVTMMYPYKRVIVVHIIILAGGFWINMSSNYSVAVVVIFYLAKIVADLFVHVRLNSIVSSAAR